MNALLELARGKKTYAAALALLALGAGGFWLGWFQAPQAAVVIALALGLFGLGDKSERYGQLLIAFLAMEKAKARQQAAGKNGGSPAAEDPVDVLLKQLSGGGAKP